HYLTLPQAFDRFVRLPPLDLEAHDAGRQLRGMGSPERHPGHSGKLSLDLCIQLVNSFRHPVFPDCLMEAKSLAERPAMLKRMKPPWRHEGGRRNRFGGTIACPIFVRPCAE